MVDESIDVPSVNVDTAFSQTTPLLPPPDVEDEEPIVMIAEQMPRFPGCEDMDMTMKEKELCSQKKLLEFLNSLTFDHKNQKTNVDRRNRYF